MPTQISGDTGVSAVQPGVVAQGDLAANVVGNGPAFNAYQSVLQSVPNAIITKVNLQSEDIDTAACFDTATSTFTPTVAGYYYFSGAVDFAAGGGGACQAFIYKNTVRVKDGSKGTAQAAVVSALLLMNGTTDSVDLRCYQNSGGAINTSASQSSTYFQGFLARAA